MALQHVLQDVPDHRLFLVHDLLGALHRLHDAALDELADDERLVELGRHVLRQPALVQLQVRAHHDNGTCAIVHALTEQVLAEAALLAFERIAQGLQRAVALALYGAALAAVVEEAVHGLLQHALLVSQDHLRRLDLHQTLEAVVADDHTAVEVVQVAGSEAAAVQGH